jgi:hypothetical protein
MISSKETSGYLATIGDERRHQPRQRHRGVDAHGAARRRMQVAGGGLRLLDLGQDLGAALVEGAARFGDAHFACGAVEQLDPEPLLERLDMARHHGRREVETLRRGGEAAMIHDLDEGGHAGNSIHRESCSTAVGGFWAQGALQAVSASCGDVQRSDKAARHARGAWRVFDQLCQAAMKGSTCR